MHHNLILDASNQAILVTNLQGIFPTTTLSGLPLGTVGSSATGELAVKILDVGQDEAVTPVFFALGASASHNIPIGAKGYSVQFLTGTGTIGGAAVAAPLVIQSQSKLAAAVTVTTDSASSAFLIWNT